MGMTRQEWNDTAEREAARAYGKKYASWYEFKNVWLPRLAVAAGLAAIGAAGYLAWKAWTLLTSATSGEAGAIPTWWVVCALVLFVTSLVAYRPGRLPSSPLGAIAKAAFFATLWIALIGFTIGTMG